MSEEKGRSQSEIEYYRKKFFLSLLVPVIFVAVLWLVKISELLFNADFSPMGI